MKSKKTWAELKQEAFSPEQCQRLDREVQQELLQIKLSALRQDRNKTQKEVAQRLDISQPAVSEREHAHDMMLSTLLAYIEALGGRLEIEAIFDDERVQLLGEPRSAVMDKERLPDVV